MHSSGKTEKGRESCWSSRGERSHSSGKAIPHEATRKTWTEKIRKKSCVMSSAKKTEKCCWRGAQQSSQTGEAVGLVKGDRGSPSD